MVRASDPARVDDAVRLYISGKSIAKAAADCGVSPNAVSAKLKADGVELRTRRKALPDAEIVSRYVAGESELALAKHFDVSRQVIRRRLEEQGAGLRDMSAAGFQRYDGSTREERAAVTAAANAAKRGKPAAESSLERAARTRERSQGPMSRYERLVAAWLAERNIAHTREKAVGRYNVDFALNAVAVEVLGGEWHSGRVKSKVHGRRTPELFRRGWHVAFVWATANHPMTEAVMEQIVAFEDFASRNPSAEREYRVIRGDGQLLSRGCLEDYEVTGIRPARDA